MKISIGHRLFAAVLLALLAVAASAVFLLRQNVLASFGDYAVGIELDRLDELSTVLARQYRNRGGWAFIPASGRGDWIAGELARLQRVRDDAAGLPAASPAAPAPPVPPVPPAAPAPPLPPLPPPRLQDGPPPAPADVVDALPLARRITLLDGAGAYVAGRPPGALPLARRALVVDGRTIGWLAVARSPRPSDAMAYAFLAQLTDSLWLIVAVAVLLSAVAASLLARHFRRPIRDLAAGAHRLAGGDFAVRLAARRSDELGDLAVKLQEVVGGCS